MIIKSTEIEKAIVSFVENDLMSKGNALQQGILTFVLGYSLGICIVFIEPVYLFIKCYDNNESYHK